jgi:hypothetical protein
MSLRSIQKGIQSQARKVLVDGSRFKRFDQIRQRYFWSTYRLSTDVNGYVASGTFDLFTTPSGQSGQGFVSQLTLRETNWVSANRVPDNQNFEITELGVSCLQVDTDTDARQNSAFPSAREDELLRNMGLAITYLTNQVPLGLCVDFSQASAPMMGEYHPAVPGSYPAAAADLGIDGVPASNVIPTNDTYYSNGFAAPGLRRRFKIPILLQHGETFKFSYLLDPGRGPFLGANLTFDVRMDFWATETFVEKS